MANTRISDVIVPEIFAPYVQNLSAEKSNLIRSGIVAPDASLDADLAGAGLTFNSPSFKDLSNEDDATGQDNVGSDDPAVLSTAMKIQTLQEVAVRMSRNGHWSSMDLTRALAGPDPMNAIANLVAGWRVKRQQKVFIALMTGVFADNAASPGGADTHTQNDMTVDIKGASYSAGVTDFNASSFIDATTTMGDSSELIQGIMVHSIVYARMQKNNLIDFVPDSEGKVNIPTFLGRGVVVDDAMPSPSAGVYESWMFGGGAVRFGVGSPKVAVEVERTASAGNGAGQEDLHNRWEWAMHPEGHAFIADVSATPGGPSNTVLAAAASWRRVFPERKQIRIARLITRES
jgi:hypothetical protein